MNKKRIWLIIPSFFLPYLILLTLATMFSVENPIFEFVMKYLFNNNGLLLIAFTLLFVLFASVLSIICFILSLQKKWDPLSLAKSVMIIKLLQIPAYIVIFILGAVFLLTIFTYAITFFLFLFDCISLILTGLITISAIINAMHQQLIDKSESILFIILQFFFVADVVSSVILYFTLLKNHKNSVFQTN